MLLLSGAVASLTDCTLGAFCAEGAPGCVDRGCRDGVKDGAESDVDCGGACAPCAAGRTCAAPADCASGRCALGLCCEAPCALWASSYGSLLDDTATDVAAAPDGSVYVVGTFQGVVDFGGGPLSSAGQTDVFALKLDAAGKHLWSTRFGGPLDDGAARLALTADGHVVIAITSANPSLDLGGGVLTGTTDTNLYAVELDAAGDHVWSRSYPGGIIIGDLAAAPDGDLALIASFSVADLGGAGQLASAGALDVLVVRLDPQGEPRWGKRYGADLGDEGQRIAVGADGALYLAVRYSRAWGFGGPLLPSSGGNFSIGIAKLDGQGAYVWSRGWVNGADQTVGGLAVDDRGAVWLAGAYTGALDVGTGALPADVGGSALVAKLDAASGDTLWARGMGEHTMAAHAVLPDADGGVVVSGYYEGDADLGGGIALAAGIGQPFVARFDAGGGALWARGEDGFGLSTFLAAPPDRDRILLAGGYRGTLDVGTGPHPSAGGADAFVAALVP